MVENFIDWREEMERCAEDPYYYYINYFTINGSKPPNNPKDWDMIAAYNKSLLGKFADRYNYKTGRID